jgi:ankyrin repeat protein
MNTSPLDIANHAILKGDLAALREAVSAGLDLHQSFSHGNTLLRNAAGRPVPGPLVLLLELGADPNHRSYYRSPVDKRFEAGFTPLMYVQTAEGAKELISRGADVNAQSDCGMTALMRARTEAIAKVLVENGANLDATNNRGTTALMFAAKGADAYVVRYLIAQGAKQ